MGNLSPGKDINSFYPLSLTMTLQPTLVDYLSFNTVERTFAGILLRTVEWSNNISPKSDCHIVILVW
jgi:hypothetical protein